MEGQQMLIGSLSACIAGDRRYTDTVRVWYDSLTDVVTVTVNETASADGIDGSGGASKPWCSFSKKTKVGPTVKEVLQLVKEVVNNSTYNFKKYGKPTKNFKWETDTPIFGLSQAHAQEALLHARNCANERSCPSDCDHRQNSKCSYSCYED